MCPPEGLAPGRREAKARARRIVKTLRLLVTQTWKEFGADNCTQMSAAMSYYILFALVPLTMFLVSLLGLAARSEEVRQTVEEDVTDYLQVDTGDVVLKLNDDNLDALEARYGSDGVAAIEQELAALNESAERKEERQELADALDAGQTVTIAGRALGPDDLVQPPDNLVAETLRGVTQASGALSIVGFVTLAFAASVVFAAIRRSLNFVWDVDVHRPLVQQKLVELGMLVGLGLLLAASVAASAALRALRELSDESLTPLSSGDNPFWLALPFLIPWLTTFLLCLLTFRYVPNAPNRFRDVWLGAVVAAAGLEVLKYGYGIYVANFASYDVVYGSLGAVLLFMSFTYLASYIFLLGAELAAEYPRVLRGDYTEAEAAEPRSLRETVIGAVQGLFVANREHAKKSKSPGGGDAGG
jgi:YihY family inner membrane protein